MNFSVILDSQSSFGARHSTLCFNLLILLTFLDNEVRPFNYNVYLVHTLYRGEKRRNMSTRTLLYFVKELLKHSLNQSGSHFSHWV